MGVYVGNKRYVPYIGAKRREVRNKKALPYDAEIEYLDSNLSRTYRNYIDTGIVPYDNHTIRFVTSIKYTTKQRRAVITNYSNSRKPVFSIELYVQGSQEKLRTYSSRDGQSANTSNIDSVSLPEDTYIDIDATIDFDELKWYVTYSFGGNQYTFNGNVFNTTYRCVDTLCLFCDHRPDASAIAYPLKMKFMKIIVDDVLTRDYIPVRVDTTGYMYDKVSGNLFGNAGTGAFVLGPDKSTLPYDAEVEYLRGTGTQYIDSGIECTGDLSIKCKFRTSTNVNSSIAGGIYQIDSRSFFRHHLTPASSSFYWLQTTGSSPSIPNSYSNNTWYEIEIDAVNGTCLINGTTKNFTPVSATQTTHANYGIFARLSGNMAIQTRSGNNDIAMCQLLRNGVLLRDYIPVRVGQTGYLYDKVSGELFGNEGTGDFILGNDKN